MHGNPTIDQMTIMDNKTICMIVYSDYQIDARVRREAETLVLNGFRVLCLTPYIGQARREFTLNGVQIKELTIAKYRGKIARRYVASYLKFLILSSFECGRLLISRNLKAVHVHNLPNFLAFAALLPKACGIKVVLDIHDTVPETYIAKFPSSHPILFRLLCWEEKISATLANRIICVNEPQRDALVARGISRDKTFVSMNVPDQRIFGGPRVGLPRNSSAFRLIYHGTMARRLGVDLVIEAAAKLAKKISNLEVHLWGNGDDLAEFQQLAEKLHIKDVVRFKPEGVPLHELPTQLACMDLGVIGNRKNMATELMLPVKLMEYISLGIPVVAPRLHTIRYYLSETMLGYFVPEDVDSMVEAIFHLYSDPQRGKTQAESAHAFLEEFGWQKQGPQLTAFYHSLISSDNLR
jgi:glycosyltransferase involved in cell wall biosynthesis